MKNTRYKNQSCSLVLILFMLMYSSLYTQNTRMLTAINMEPRIGFVVSDEQNNTYVFGMTTTVYYSDIKPYPYDIIGCNDLFLSKYDPNGKLLWRKIFGGHNFHKPPVYGCDRNNEVSYGLYFNRYNNTLVIAFDYQDSVKLDDQMYYSGYLPWSNDYNMIIAGVDLNGDFLWVNNFGNMGTEEFGGLVILPEKIVWAGSVKYNLTVGNKNLERGSFLATMSHTGQISEIKNVFFRQDGSVENTSKIIQLALAKDEIIAQAVTQAPAFRMENVAIPNPQDWSMILAHVDFNLGVESIEIVYKQSPKAENFTTLHVNSQNGDFVLSHHPRNTDIYFYGDTLPGQTGWEKVYFFSKKHTNKVVKTGINSSAGLGFETGAFNKTGEFYAFFTTRESDIYTSTDTAYDVTGTVMMQFNEDGKSQIVETFSNMWEQAVTFDAFERIIIGVSSKAPLQFQGFSANSIFPSDYFLLKYSMYSKLLNQPENYLNIFPNPASDYVSIILPDVAFTGAYIVSLFDSHGQLVNQNSFVATGEIISLTTDHLPAGVYQVSVTSGKSFYASKLVIVR